MAASTAPTRLLCAAATIVLLGQSVAWAGSLVDARPLIRPAQATAADPFAFTREADQSSQTVRSPLMEGATPAPPPTELPAARDVSRPDYGPQVVPLPPALYPGLVLLAVAFLKLRKP